MVTDEVTTPTDHLIHAELRPPIPNAENFPARRQAMSEMAFIHGMKNVLDTTHTTLDETSPLHSTNTRNCQIMRMAIRNPLPSAFAATFDLELGALTLQMAQKITDHFTDGTTTAHVLLKQEG